MTYFVNIVDVISSIIVTLMLIYVQVVIVGNLLNVVILHVSIVVKD